MRRGHGMMGSILPFRTTTAGWATVLLLVVVLPLHTIAQQQQVYDPTTNTFQEVPLQRLHIAGLYDLRSFPEWPVHLLKATVALINNKTDGWHDDLLLDAQLTATMNNSACDPDAAVRAYLGMMRLTQSQIHAVFGCRCSGASMAVGGLCAVENIPMLSPVSTSSKLSNKDEYETFSRMVAPDDKHGTVGALVTLLRSFGWDRISVIATDTQYTQDIAIEMSSAWKGKHFGDDPFVGEIAFSDTIKLNRTDDVDLESVMRVLKAVPVDNAAINSRVIVLFAHHQHAFPILQVANQLNFQPDTIWVGTMDWAGRRPIDEDTSWMPPIPGYVGLTPYRNLTSPVYTNFLKHLQQYERDQNLPITSDLYDHVADRFVDGILALAKTFEAIPPDLRKDGWLVSRELRKLEFDGLSGPIAFTDKGDMKDPRFTVVTLKQNGTDWRPIGYVTPNSVNVDHRRVCYAQVGCVTTIPNDSYPTPKDPLPFWIWIALGFLPILSILAFHQRWKNRTATEQLNKIESQLKALDSNDDAVKQRKGRLYKEIAGLLGQPLPKNWTRHHGPVDVLPHEKEYWDVLEKLRSTMNKGETCHLSKLSRIQNVGIWSYYVFRKNQLANKYGTDMNDKDKVKEVSAWHGTSSLNPDIIFNDQQDGFMMQLSQQGHWGRGIYFSERSGYVDPYSFKPLTEHYDDAFQQDRELFLVKLLVGEAIFLDRTEGEFMQNACKNLVAPPDNPNRIGKKFDTVAGEIDGTKLWVVYENGRAYPEYLVRYYKGDRDETRTPFNSIEEALVAKALKDKLKKEAEQEEAPPRSFWDSFIAAQILQQRNNNNDDDNNDVDPDQSVSGSVLSSASSAVKAVWQYQNVDDDGKWENYLDGHQIQLENAYQRDALGATTIEHFPWTYAIDFSVNIQTNLDHPDKTTRRIRRIVLDSSPPAASGHLAAGDQ